MLAWATPIGKYPDSNILDMYLDLREHERDQEEPTPEEDLN
jgi:hypothetical protein